MRKTLLIPDTHGDHDAAVRLLRKVGALDADYQRTPGWLVVHMGDLIDARESTVADDGLALALVEDGLIDLLLVGNHEQPYFYGQEFYGFHFDADLSERLRALKADGKLVAAHAHGSKLITHAGVTPFWGARFGWTNPYDAAKEINALWVERPQHSLFDQLGKARGGLSETGGILWSDFEEPRFGGFNQIHGHTFVGPQWKNADDGWHYALCLDNGGGKFTTNLAGAVLEGCDVTVVHSGRAHPEFLDSLLDVVETTDC